MILSGDIQTLKASFAENEHEKPRTNVILTHLISLVPFYLRKPEVKI